MFHAYRKWGAGVMLAACGVIPFIGGCAAAGPGTSPGGAGGLLVARDSANGHTVTVTVGEHLEVILGSTYWTMRGSTHPGVLRQDGPTSLMPRPADCAANIPGLGCVPVRTDFSALAAGTTVVTASRVTCGEALRCMPGQEHYTLTVIVRAKG
ncbi:MAG TPA: hypothetical protein VKG80_17215 [Trebonia sp.]|nr:hypothetical protein [Trebonia sp.]